MEPLGPARPGCENTLLSPALECTQECETEPFRIRGGNCRTLLGRVAATQEGVKGSQSARTGRHTTCTRCLSRPLSSGGVRSLSATRRIQPRTPTATTPKESLHAPPIPCTRHRRPRLLRPHLLDARPAVVRDTRGYPRRIVVVLTGGRGACHDLSDLRPIVSGPVAGRLCIRSPQGVRDLIRIVLANVIADIPHTGLLAERERTVRHAPTRATT